MKKFLILFFLGLAFFFAVHALSQTLSTWPQLFQPTLTIEQVDDNKTDALLNFHSAQAAAICCSHILILADKHYKRKPFVFQFYLCFCGQKIHILLRI